MRNNSFIHTALMSCLLLLCGCSKEQVPDTLPPTGGLTLRYTIDNLADGQATDASTYAGTILAPTSDEAKVDEMTLLFFDVADTGNGAYRGYATATEAEIKNPTVNAWEMHITKFTPVGGVESDIDFTKDYSVMAIANYTANGLSLDDIKSVVEAPNATERSVKYALVVDNAATIKSPFLMSGSGKYSGKEKSVTIALRRNVAKLKVINTLGNAVFELKKVWVSNMRAKSYAMDMQGEMPVEIIDEVRQETALASGVREVSLYCFESYTEMAGTAEKTTLCLILQGVYRGFDRYYRLNVNLHEVDPVSQRYVQRINRNALYQMTITGVLGGGMESLEEALAGAADQLVTRESFLWEENFDGIYNYASNGIGFAPSLSAINKRLVNFTGEDIRIDLFWSDHYMAMDTPPAKNEVTVTSSDPNIVTATLSDDCKYIDCVLKKWGEAVITIQYGDAAVREIPVKIQSVLQSNIYIKNLIVPKYNVGASESDPYGKYYTVKKSKLTNGTVCPSGYRLPTRSEIDHMYANGKGPLQVTESGFVLSIVDGIISLFPNAGKANNLGVVSEKDTKAYYLTASVTGDLANPQAIIYETIEEVIDGKKRVKLGIKEDVAYDDDNNDRYYSVRCIGTQDTNAPYEFVDHETGKTYWVKVSVGTNYATYVNNKPEGYELAGTAMTDKILQNGGFPGGGSIPLGSWYWGDPINDTQIAGRLYGRKNIPDVLGKVIAETYLTTSQHQGFYIMEVTAP